jgi:hypothetical protein
MEKQMLNRRELTDQADPGRTPARPQSMAAALAESEDVLIADPRGQMTPAQMVDQKLLALLGSCPRSLQPDNLQAESGLRSPSSATRVCLRPA